MKAENKIVNLLHDTSLDAVKFKNDNLEFVFSFMLDDDIEEKIIIKSNNISHFSCIELLVNNEEKKINWKQLINSDCSKFQIEKNKVNLFLENVYRNTYIKVKYNSSNNTVSGDIDKLKEFWEVTEDAVA